VAIIHKNDADAKDTARVPLYLIREVSYTVAA
jgi:hypothetical protein